MSCKNKAKHCANAHQGPSGVPTGAMNPAGQRQCPECAGWLRADGGCTKCDNRLPDEEMDEYTAMINDHSQKYGISPELVELANYAFWDDSGPLGQHMVEKLGSSFSFKDCLEHVAKTSSEEIELMTSLSPDTPDTPPTLAMATPTVSSAIASAAATGETVSLSSHWRHEFPRKDGEGITLRNGETLYVGQRFGAKKHGEEYTVPLGKARRVATVGATITPAVDQMVDWDWTNDGFMEVKTSDGGVGYYDPKLGVTCCGGNCDKSKEGMCHHQMAAVIVGEIEDATGVGSTEDEELKKQLSEQIDAKSLPKSPLSTVEVVRRSDAVYAYLKAAIPEIQVNVESLKPPPEKSTKKSGAKQCPDCNGFLRSDGGCTKCEKKKSASDSPPPEPSGHGNPAVDKIMTDLNVNPPLPTLAQVMADDPSMEGYTGFPVPAPDPRYEVGDQEKTLMTQIMQRTQMSWNYAGRRVEATGGDSGDPDAYPASMEDRCWGLYGPPGTGKNSMAKEIAASLGLGYMEQDVRDRSDFQSLLCDVTFPKEGDKTYSEVRLGPIGQALHSGNVVAINEIVAADPDAQTALHQVLQDGIIRAPGPEGATQYWKVHPNSMVFLTWNPNTTRADKPAPALLSRTPSLEMDYPKPEDEARRLSSTMSEYMGHKVEPKEVKRCVTLIRGLRELHLLGELESCPTYREMVSFTKSYFLNGQDRHKAGEVLKVLTSQAPGIKDDEWKQVHNLLDGFQEGTWKV